MPYPAAMLPQAHGLRLLDVATWCAEHVARELLATHLWIALTQPYRKERGIAAAAVAPIRGQHARSTWPMKARGALTGRHEMHRARTWSVLSALVLAIGVVSPVARADDINDYPTTARADYVFGCMKANGETERSLEQCSCSIDVIASLMPYDRYVAAETVLRMAQVQGNLGAQFRSTEQARTLVDDLRRAQAEAEVRCF
jgi:hypothetical protein